MRAQTACPPFRTQGEMVGTAQGRLCPPYGVRATSSLEQEENRGGNPGNRIESAERSVGAAVPVPGLRRRRMGPHHPAVQDSALPDSGAGRRGGGAVARLAGTDGAG